MGKLKIECLQRKLKVKKLAAAVYQVLGQKAKLKAEVVFESGKEMTDLNRTARGVDSVTDVLSFPSLEGIKGEILERDKCNTELDGKYIFIGSIVLCDEKIRAQAQELGLSALVEAHTAGEVQQALAAGAEIIGVNNRNLKDFSVNPVNSLRLRDAIPASKIFVAESGIKCAADTQALKQAGVQAVLVGEALMRSADAAAMLKEMRDA